MAQVGDAVFAVLDIEVVGAYAECEVVDARTWQSKPYGIGAFQIGVVLEDGSNTASKARANLDQRRRNLVRRQHEIYIA